MDRTQLITQFMNQVATMGRQFAFKGFKDAKQLQSPAQFGVLMMLSQHEMSTSELAEKMGVTPGAISQLVDPLVETGLLERLPDSDDRRKFTLRLSEKGNLHIKQLKSERAASMKQMLEPLTDEELTQFMTLLTKILSSHGERKA